MRGTRLKPLVAAVCMAVVAFPLHSAEAPAGADGKWTFDTRLRWEQVDDAAFSREADAFTVRARLGYWTPVRNGFGGVFEALLNQHLFGQRFNSTTNRRTQYPVVADPDKADLHQAYVSYAPSAGRRVALGRQKLNYDNQRFIGAVGWRQNEQTFDALDVQHRFGNGLNLRYSYLDRVQRVFGGDDQVPSIAAWQLDTHLLNISHALGPGTLSAYGYFIENQTLPQTSHRDFGLRYVAKKTVTPEWEWMCSVEMARQDDYARGSAAIDAHYWLAEAGAVWRGNGFKLGVETLSGDGTYAFQTPLATLHAFNGWADRFLTTPVNGLQDRYLSWNRAFGKFNAQVAWHDFRADRGSLRYGSEWDAALAYAWSPHWNTQLKLADYRADDVGADVQKTWLSIEYIH